MHGGDIYSSRIKHDFSVNLNPTSIPLWAGVRLAFSLGCIRNYPDPDCRELRAAIADSWKVRSELIVCGGGATEILRSAFCCSEKKTALLVSPCYTGYERILNSLGFFVERIMLEPSDGFYMTEEKQLEFCEKIQESKPGVVLLANPNNPNGLLAGKTFLDRVACSCGQSGSLFVLDECFVQLTQEGEAASFVPFLSADVQVVVVNAFTKFFSIPGLRLGYGICSSRELAEKLKFHACEWSAGTLAQKAGVLCLGMNERYKKAVLTLNVRRRKLASGLEKLGFEVFDSSSCFLLFRVKNELGNCTDCNIWQRLRERGILIRDCSDYSGLGHGYYRVAVKSTRENRILLAALEDVL